MTWKRIIAQSPAPELQKIVTGDPLPTYGKGRVCAHPGCETILRQTNKSKYCGSHEKDSAYQQRIRAELEGTATDEFLDEELLDEEEEEVER